MTTASRRTTSAAPYPTVGDESTWWVPAAPFRAHLYHLVDSTGLSWQVVARAAGVPSRVAEHLCSTPPRRVGRIRRVDAQRLLALDVEGLTRRLVEPRPASPARDAARCLLARGWTLERLATATGQERGLLERVVAGRSLHCPLATTLELEALLLHERTESDRARLRLVA